VLVGLLFSPQRKHPAFRRGERGGMPVPVRQTGRGSINLR
jgi:hypothetical protein